MNSKKDFGDGPIYTITNYIFWIFLSNFYFILVNIPLLFLLVSLSISPETNLGIITYLCILPVGPSLVALLSVMGKLVREKDVNTTKEFFKAYKKNFIEAIFYWTLQIVILTILNFDISFVISKFNSQIMVVIIRIIQVFVITLGFFIYPIMSRFYFKVNDLIKISIKYYFKKINITITNIAIVIALYFMLTKISFLILFAVSIACYGVMYFEKEILSEIEEEVKKNTEKIEE